MRGPGGGKVAIRTLSTVLFFLLAVAGPLVGQQQPGQKPGSVEDYIQRHWQETLHEFNGFLALPNVASDSVNIGRNAQAVARMLEQRGLKTRLLEFENAPPALLAEAPAKAGLRTVIFYAHYDGQPVQRVDWKQTHGNPPRSMDGFTPAPPAMTKLPSSVYWQRWTPFMLLTLSPQ